MLWQGHYLWWYKPSLQGSKSLKIVFLQKVPGPLPVFLKLLDNGAEIPAKFLKNLLNMLHNPMKDLFSMTVVGVLSSRIAFAVYTASSSRPGRKIWPKYAIILVEKGHFWSLKTTPTSLSDCKTIPACSMSSSGVRENIKVSYKYTRAYFHFTVDGMKSVTR